MKKLKSMLVSASLALLLTTGLAGCTKNLPETQFNDQIISLTQKDGLTVAIGWNQVLYVLDGKYTGITAALGTVEAGTCYDLKTKIVSTFSIYALLAKYPNLKGDPMIWAAALSQQKEFHKKHSALYDPASGQ